MSLRMSWVAVALLAVLFFCADVRASEVKIGVFNIQNVLTQSTRGQEIKQRIEGRAKQLEAKFKPEQDALIALQKDIDKKSSAWSEEVKADKIREFQKRQRELQSNAGDARFEMDQMKNKEMEPFMRALQGVIAQLGKDGGYTMIVQVQSPFEYFSPSIDVSDAVIKRLNAALK